MFCLILNLDAFSLCLKMTAQTIASSRSNTTLKRLLLVYNKQDEPKHFFKCNKEMFASFVSDPIIFDSEILMETILNVQTITFLKLFAVVDHFEFAKNYTSLLNEFDMVAFTLYSGASVLEESMKYLKPLLKEKIAVLFLRGYTASAPLQLGYINDTMVGFTSSFMLYASVLEKLAMNSPTIHEFKHKHCMKLLDVGGVTTPELADMYLNGVTLKSLCDPEKWNIIAVDSNESQGTLLFHKEERALFTPWYGFSHGNELNHDIVAYFCKFLLFEHLVKRKDNLGKNLLNKHKMVQLSDLSINTID